MRLVLPALLLLLSTPLAAAPCGDVSAEGCCDGAVRRACVDEALVVEDCSATDPARLCGWADLEALAPGYYCGDAGEVDPGGDPDGIFPAECPMCAPDCAGKVCGSDGCGGSCGGCDDGLCDEATGQCVAGACGDLGAEGCCLGATLRRCVVGQVTSQDCAAADAAWICGWAADAGDGPGYACGAEGDVDPLGDPEGIYPLECPLCEPTCAGKSCGPDGCGGSCGGCALGTCDEALGQCVTGACGDVGAVGCCDGAARRYCLAAQLVYEDCAAKEPVRICGWGEPSGQSAGYHCGATDEVDPMGDPDGLHPVDCAICEPDCEGKVCGPDGCGGSCGDCPGEVCDEPTGQCIADECGELSEEGCCDGVILKACRVGQPMSLDCAAQAAGYVCGWLEDGQQAGYACGLPDVVELAGDPSGAHPLTCAGPCESGCDGVACDVDDGCGGTCGCADGMSCVDGLCQTCVPDCAGRVCGSDGCGGSCGVCAQGACVEALGICSDDACQGVTAAGCCDGDDLFRCEAGALTVLACDAPENGLDCGWSEAAAAYACATDGEAGPEEGLPLTCPWVCLPDCEGKTCGPDGCGGDCGGCYDGSPCTEDACVDGACVFTPVTEGQACSDDGNPCTIDGCQAGACVHAPLADGEPCPGDGFVCTVDACQGGVCKHTPEAACLIDGVCLALGQVHDTKPCLACTADDPHGWGPLPDDSACPADTLSCTADVCLGGACIHPVRDACLIDGGCRALGEPRPDDPCQACTADDPTGWSPLADGDACADDGLACTMDQCQSGICVHTPASGCTLDGVCYEPGAAHPTDPCRVCDPDTPDAWSAGPDLSPCVDDGLACTADHCLAGACAHPVTQGCLIDGACHADGAPRPQDPCARCDAGAPLAWSPEADGLACADEGDPCTTDHCLAGACAHPLLDPDCGARVCGPSPSGCHACGACEAGSGCNDQGQCDDACALVDCPECQACQGGVCVSAQDGAVCADDDEICTLDLCVEGTCLHAARPDGFVCDDADACTLLDLCQGGACAGLEPVVCEPLDDCHAAGACDPETGACDDPALPDDTPCGDDDLACTADLCQAGVCAHPVETGCLLDGACVAEGAPSQETICQVCDPAAPLEWAHAEDGLACDDERFCTTTDACEAGACVGGPPPDCGAWADDCNEAGCDVVLDTCVAIPVEDGSACEDGLFCSVDDHCDAGHCEAGAERDCSALAGECAGALCDPEASACVLDPWAAGIPCGDGPVCEDGVYYMEPVCDGQGGCVTWNGEPCTPYAVCGDDQGCAETCEADEDCSEGFECLGGECRTNAPPVAVAGMPQVVGEGSSVTLDGRGSWDPDGDALSYDWDQIGGPSVFLSNPGGGAPQFVAPAVVANTPLTFSLMVSDGFEDSPPDETQVMISNSLNEPPIAVILPVIGVDEGQLVTLNGSASFDPNGDPLSFAWSQESGPTATMVDANTSMPTFEAPALTADAILVFSLVVNDGQANSAPATVEVSVADLPEPDDPPEPPEEVVEPEVDEPEVVEPEIDEPEVVEPEIDDPEVMEGVAEEDGGGADLTEADPQQEVTPEATGEDTPDALTPDAAEDVGVDPGKDSATPPEDTTPAADVASGDEDDSGGGGGGCAWGGPRTGAGPWVALTLLLCLLVLTRRRRDVRM